MFLIDYLRLLNVLTRYRTREQFFEYMTRWTPFDIHKKESIRVTYALMEKQFEGVRRESGGPYMDHLRSVAIILMIHLGVIDPDEILAALLHDVTEHFPEEWPNTRIEEMYGRPVAYLVDTMSKLPVIWIPGETGRDYEKRVEARNRQYHLRFRTAKKAAVRLKMSDWMHNILTLIYCAPDKQRRKWLEALEYALPRALEHNVLHGELWTALYSPVLFAFPSIPGPAPHLLV